MYEEEVYLLKAAHTCRYNQVYSGSVLDFSELYSVAEVQVGGFNPMTPFNLHPFPVRGSRLLKSVLKRPT